MPPKILCCTLHGHRPAEREKRAAQRGQQMPRMAVCSVDDFRGADDAARGSQDVGVRSIRSLIIRDTRDRRLRFYRQPGTVLVVQLAPETGDQPVRPERPGWGDNRATGGADVVFLSRTVNNEGSSAYIDADSPTPPPQQSNTAPSPAPQGCAPRKAPPTPGPHETRPHCQSRAHPACGAPR